MISRTRSMGRVIRFESELGALLKLIVRAKISLLTKKYSPSIACSGSFTRGNSRRASEYESYS